MLVAGVSGGGRLIYTDWRQAGLDGAVFTGGVNETSLTLGLLFGAGIVSPLAVTNPGWGTFSMGLAAGPGAIVAATFGNGQGAIVVGSSGRTIVNGFLSDTVASQQLYANEINYMLSSGVPEPSTWAMMLIGFAGLGLAARKRRREEAMA
ncbi:MAG: PEPxxWA-CTERM sorting domain-containing protein [Methylobacteriaceae bacterium]|nr:PEPxxWA-CTERM sorting domain-containing protein [Methylobacteriaceae bacterium]